jgi:tRNA(Ile)-lysidine synthase
MEREGCRSVWDILRPGEPGLTEHAGFAISGGVDSMALASLYSRAQRTRSSLPSAYGFIVDHKARPESTEEAKWVAEQLRQECERYSLCLSLAHC